MPRRALVLTCDRWHLDFLGCYGNDWLETPNLSKLAAHGVVFDRHFAACVDPEFASLAWWTGRTQIPHPVDSAPSEWNISGLSAAGIRTVLFVEDSQEHSSQVTPPFDEIHAVQGRDDLEAKETATPFARLVMRVEEWLAENSGDDRPTLLWLRSRGVPIPWLPPQGFVDLYLDDFGLKTEVETSVHEVDDGELPLAEGPEFIDDEIAEFAEEQDLAPEQSRVSEETRYALAMYASYATMLDRWFGRLMATITRNPIWNAALVVFTAATGQPFFATGDEGASNLDDLAHGLPLRGELIQTPLIVRLPGVQSGDLDHAGTRRPALVQTVDLLPTMFDWFEIPPSEEFEGASVLPVIRQQIDEIHESLVIGDAAGAVALCTQDVLYVESTGTDPEDEPRIRLFEKPFDRWDVSDVANQSPGRVDELREELSVRLNRVRDSRRI